MLEVTIHEYVSPWWCDCSLRSHQNYNKCILPYMHKKCMCMFALPYQIEICLHLHVLLQTELYILFVLDYYVHTGTTLLRNARVLFKYCSWTCAQLHETGMGPWCVIVTLLKEARVTRYRENRN